MTELRDLLDAAKSERDTAEAALDEAVGLLQEWNDTFPLSSLETETFLAQHTTPPCADGG